MARACTHCAADISSRDSRATQCFPCLYGRDKRVGAAYAYRKVRCAIRAGILSKASDLQCVDCGGQARDYDHRDYSKPLEVQPVCRRCNKLRGPALPLLADHQLRAKAA